MADEHDRYNLSPNPDPQSNRVSRDVITHPQEQQIVLASPPKSLVEAVLGGVFRRCIPLGGREVASSTSGPPE
jgi:hypothetical protein